MKEPKREPHSVDGENPLITRSKPTPKTKPSTKEQQKYNRTQATKKLIRLVNENFDGTDYLMPPPYSPENAPQTEAEARRDIVNYLRRVNEKKNSKLQKEASAGTIDGNDF